MNADEIRAEAIERMITVFEVEPGSLRSEAAKDAARGLVAPYVDALGDLLPTGMETRRESRVHDMFAAHEYTGPVDTWQGCAVVKANTGMDHIQPSDETDYWLKPRESRYTTDWKRADS